MTERFGGGEGCQLENRDIDPPVLRSVKRLTSNLLSGNHLETLPSTSTELALSSSSVDLQRWPGSFPSDSSARKIGTALRELQRSTSEILVSSNAALSNRWMFYRFLCLDFPVTDAWLCINSYPTVVKRWPTILTNVISAVSSVNHELQLRLSSPDASVGDKERASFAYDLEQGKEIIRRLSGLKHDMGRDRKLEYVARTALAKNFADIQTSWTGSCVQADRDRLGRRCCVFQCRSSLACHPHALPDRHLVHRTLALCRMLSVPPDSVVFCTKGKQREVACL